MEQTLLSEAAKNGLFALMFVALLWWVMKENANREKRYQEREDRYQDRENKYLAVIQTLGEEVLERLGHLESWMKGDKK